MTSLELRPILTLLYCGLIMSLSGACSAIGPSTVERDRIDYAAAIGESWKQQTLLNVVKLRYSDVPIFLEISQVVAGYQLEGSIGAGFNAANSAGGTIGPFAAGGSVLAQGTYIDRPTLIYAPLTGNDFLKRLMTPIPPRAILFILQSSYAADIPLLLAVSSINGVTNGSRRATTRAADPQFARLVQLISDLQSADAIQIRFERSADDPNGAIFTFPPIRDPQLLAKANEIRNILHLNPGLQEFHIYSGGYSGKDNEISMMTRSMVQIMAEMGTFVRVPASDVTSGKALPGAVDTQSPDTQGLSLLDVASGDTPPRDAYAAVKFDGHWFWIADTDSRSKRTFQFLMMMFSISDTGVNGIAPVVTVPTN